MKYVQCRFEQQQPDGIAKEVAFIEKRGAIVGARVELKGKEGLWLVTAVSDSITKEQFVSAVTRNKFDSIKHK